MAAAILSHPNDSPIAQLGFEPDGRRFDQVKVRR